MMQSRLASFAAKLPEREVDAILVSGAENRLYLSGSRLNPASTYPAGAASSLKTS